MPAQQRTSDEIRAELADVTARAEALANRESEATAELADAQEQHGRLYAAGADASTIKRAATAATALRVELDGIGLGRSLLAQQTESLTAELVAAEACEVLQTAREAEETAHAAALEWQAFVSAMLAHDGEYARADAALRAAVERNRAATARALDTNPSERAELERRFANFWLRYPGAAQFSDAAEAYRRTARTAPVQDAAA